MKVPFADLKKQYISIQSEIDCAIKNVIDETSFIGGHFVKSFEQSFASKIGMKHCIGVANGTDAIYIVLKMLGVSHGDEVITVANSWISTSETISQTGATPVFVDVDEYYTIDAKKIEARITNKTKAIIPVHLYGQPADMGLIMEIADRYKIPVIEDCAQSHFSKYQERYVGTFGVASTFSFYPGKNLGAYGDAGGIVTNDEELARRCRQYANHGALVKHQHEIEGINSRLDSLQAAILSVKLKYLTDWNEARIRNTSIYIQSLKHVDAIELPLIRENCKHTFHLFVIKISDRENLKKYLAENEIETAIHYPTPLPLLPAYKYLGYAIHDFPIACANQNTILSLPMFPEILESQIGYVCDTIKRFYQHF